MSAESERIQRKFEEAKRASAAARRRGVPVSREDQRRIAGLERQVAVNRRKQAEDRRRAEAKEARRQKRLKARTAARLAAAEQARADRKAAERLRKARAAAEANKNNCPGCRGKGKTWLGSPCGRCNGSGRR